MLLAGIAYGSAYFGRGNGSIAMDDVRCNGTEQKLVDCPHTSEHNCIRYEDAGVRCIDTVHSSLSSQTG